MTDFSVARKNMVDCQIHTASVVTPAILDAFRETPREKFVPAALAGIAYHDEDISLGKNRFLLAPATLARMMEAAAPSEGDRVLDIGGTNGYAAYILARLCEHVTALEDKSEFSEKLTSLAKAGGLKNVTAVTGGLTAGHEAGAPYDLIFINGAISFIPEKLGAQLKPGGRMITIFREKGAFMGQVVIVRRTDNGALSSYPLFETAGSWLPGFEPKTTFNFGR